MDIKIKIIYIKIYFKHKIYLRHKINNKVNLAHTFKIFLSFKQ